MKAAQTDYALRSGGYNGVKKWVASKKKKTKQLKILFFLYLLCKH